jgi:arginase
VVSGDCTTTLGVVAGLQHAGVDPAIVWFDAHGDLQTPETTASGYVGGMPLRILVGYRPELVAQRLRLRAIPESHAVLVDARDLDPPEAEYLAAADIRRADVDGLTTGALPEGPLVLHLDLDVVDPDELPGLRFPAPGGPAVADVLTAARRVLDTGRVAALSVGCTWHPGVPQDPAGVRARLLSALMRPPDAVDAANWFARVKVAASRALALASFSRATMAGRRALPAVSARVSPVPYERRVGGD